MKKTIKLSKALYLSNELELFLTEKGVEMKSKIKARKTFNSFKNDIVSYNETRNQLIEELGEKKDGKISVKKENLVDFEKQNTNALNQSIDLELFLEEEDLNSIGNDSGNYYGNLIDILLD